MAIFHTKDDSKTFFNIIDQSAKLEDKLDAISYWLEQGISNSIVSVMLYSEKYQTLNMKSGFRSFTNNYLNTIKNLKIGSCGAAAFHRKLIVCVNVLTDCNWTAYKSVMKQEGLQACWSMPILSRTGKLYGIFATHYPNVRSPTFDEIEIIQSAASILALTMDLYDEQKKRVKLEDKYQSFFSFYPDAIFEHDLEGKIIDANIAADVFNKQSFQSFIGEKIDHFIESTYQPLALKAFEKAKQGYTDHIEVEAHNSIGEKYWVDLTFLPIKEDDKIAGIFTIMRDITERYQNNKMLRLLKCSVDANPHGVILTSAKNDQIIEYVNPAFEQMTGYTLNELLDKNCRILQGVDTDYDVVSKIREAIRKQSEINAVLKNYRKDISWFWNGLTLEPGFDEKNICTHFMGIQQDITQKNVQKELIDHQESYDSLTNLINHKQFEEILDSNFYISSIKQTSLVLLYIDLDDFSPLNQSLGHKVGDIILKVVAERLIGLLQSDGMISRFSGDEFAILLNSYEDLKNIIVLAEKILKILSQPFEINGNNIHISASIGIADNDPHIKNGRQFLNTAIDAMKDAQAEGGNTWYWYNFNKILLPKIDYVSMRYELMIALKQNQFKVFYQPIMDAKTGEIKCLEALIRWQHPERGFIAPDEFIPFAEKTGQIIAVGEWVLKKACKEIKDWNTQYNKNISVAINLSALQFRRSGFLEELLVILAETELPYELLKLEVTESMLIADTDTSLTVLREVRALGVKVSVDDFGTGYSSLSYLRYLPIDEVKLDRNFIKYIIENKKDEAIVEAIIIMAHNLDLKVVAEGVEIYQQAKWLIDHDCNYLQGFYYAKPAPLDQLKLPVVPQKKVL